MKLDAIPMVTKAELAYSHSLKPSRRKETVICVVYLALVASADLGKRKLRWRGERINLGPLPLN